MLPDFLPEILDLTVHIVVAHPFVFADQIYVIVFLNTVAIAGCLVVALEVDHDCVGVISRQLTFIVILSALPLLLLIFLFLHRLLSCHFDLRIAVAAVLTLYRYRP